MSSAAVINATQSSGQTAGSPVTIATDGTITPKLYGTGSGAWSVTAAFAPVVNGVVGNPISLTITENNPNAVGPSIRTDAVQWVGWITAQTGIWKASGIVEGVTGPDAQSGFIGTFAAGTLPQYAVEVGTLASEAGTLVRYGGVGVGWVADAATPFPSGGDDTAILNAALAGGGNIKLAFGETYSITAPLLVPSNTRFDLNGATISAVGTTHRMIQNAGYGVSRNENIEVFGGALTAGSVDGPTHRLVLLSVDGLSVHNMKFTSTSGKYAILLADVTDFSVSEIEFETASDGLHVTGPAKRGSIRNLRGTTGDDFCALGCSDYLAYDVSRGDIDGVVIDGLYPVEAADGGNGCKLFCVSDASIMDTMVLRNVHVSNIFGTVKENGIFVMDYAANNGSFQNITIDNISVRNALQSGWNQVSISPSAPVFGLNIGGVSVPANQPVANAMNGINIATGTTISDVQIRNLNDETPATHTINLLLIQATGTLVKRLLVCGSNTRYKGVGKYFAKLTNSAKVEDMDLAGVVFNHEYGIRLVSAAELKNLSLANIVIEDGGTVISLGTDFATDIKFSGIHMKNGVFLSITGTSASASLHGSGWKMDVGTPIYRSASQTFNPVAIDYSVDLSKTTKTQGNIARNTNAGLSCGLGIAACDGTIWKNLVSGLTY